MAYNREEKCKDLDPRAGVVACSLSKCVFKKGRKTISPEFMLRASNLLPDNLQKDDLEVQSGENTNSVDAEEWTYARIEEERLREKKDHRHFVCGKPAGPGAIIHRGIRNSGETY
ncbi:27fc71fe-83d7-4bdb-b8cf-3550d5dc1640 [Sclerotinia trifoliorum]|uniref:27fc71fe-83d7-4bdb-b8cf-3550d5dc1640 n=1 Tax=Sclerotinia trifoliorum TaxID=28548 RepID=A0A8H2W620_9HELO|nr:27fc71fe-83d7-4bdb-b8cf-3550d5dc1640 [Sclerotinia trifoliorum]